ncbi:MAG: hypothetical protein M1837_001916 [Sclerophora amabilis]|nr:MAG: hypothetical protein M1837_001916 [Sclerophora amabilis]
MDMASVPSNTSSSLSRYRPALIFLTGLTALYGVYYLRSQFSQPGPPRSSSTSLRRRNAVHRRHDARRAAGEPQHGGAETSQDASNQADELSSFYDAYTYISTTQDGRQISIPLDPLTLPTSERLQDQYGISTDEAHDIRDELEQQFLENYLPMIMNHERIPESEDHPSSLGELRDDLIGNRGFSIRIWDRAMERVAAGNQRMSLNQQAGATTQPDRPSRPLDGNETVVDADSDFSWRGGDEHGRSKDGENLLKLLYHIAEEQARREGYVHRGVTCNSCGTMPILGIRYRCANCVDFDLCETCEAMQVHPKTHLFYKVRIPAPFLANPRQAQPVWYPGKPEGLPQNLTHTLKSRLVKETGFENSEVEAMWDQFKCLAATEWMDDPNKLGMAIDRRTFDKCFAPASSSRPPPPNLIYDRTFAFYDVNGDGMIGFEEFLKGLACLNNKTKEERLKRIFQGYDIDGDGFVDRRDFLRIFRAFYALSKELTRDMISGAEDDVMEGVNVRDIVLGSQPLSSAFTGHIPHGERSRTAQGKQANTNGDLEIVDDEGVIRESTNDTTERYAVLGDAAERQAAESTSHPRRPWDSMLVDSDNTALEAALDEALARESRPTNGNTNTNAENDADENEETDDDGNDTDGSWTKDWWPPDWVTSEDLEVVGLSSETPISQVPVSSRSEVLEAAKKRVREEEKRRVEKIRQDAIKERWRRRQFYIDEEEGAGQPEGLGDFLDEDTNLLMANGKKASIADNLDAQPAEAASRPPSPRSRSSSKVRFQDDVTENDYEVRSNPSTSSRSIPFGERWGGYEIPEAEKDVGREILYQVTQQGMNEMLDPLFKRKEDLALEALATREEREQNRDSISELETSETKNVDKGKGKDKMTPTLNGTAGSRYNDPKSDDIMSNGISVPFPSFDGNSPASPKFASSLEDPLRQTPPLSTADVPALQFDRSGNNNDSPTASSTIDHSILSLPLPTLLERSGYMSEPSLPSGAVPEPPSPPRSPPPDPTLPQNRPSTIIDDIPPSPPPDMTLPQNRPSHPEPSIRTTTPSPHDPSSRLFLLSHLPTFAPQPSRERLSHLRLLDKIEKEIDERGGAGRIGFLEFRRAMLGEPSPPEDGDVDVDIDRMRDRRGDGGGRAMAFLGSWVEMASF